MIEQGVAFSRTAAAAMIFSMTFGVVYALCFYFNWPLFAYYPQVNEVHLDSNLIETHGPPILWYGWLASAALASIAAAAIVPRRAADRLWHGWAWVIPAAVVVAILIYEQRWFL